MSEAPTYSGDFRACGHTISFWYRLDDKPLTEEAKEAMEEEAERRAREMIAQDYTSGELECSFTQDDETESEFSGWWNIERGA